MPLVVPNERFRGWRDRPALAAALAALLCFFTVLPNDFASDGVPIVQQNPGVNSPGQWLTLWTTDYWSHLKDAIPNRDLLYRPVTLSSYRLIRMLFGAAAWPQHLANLLLHAGICACIVRLGRHLGMPREGLFATGIFFAVLPIHCEVVANVVGRADLLAALGVLITLLGHRRSCFDSDSLSLARRWGWRLVTLFFAFVAVGSKESAIGLIALAPMFDVYWRTRIDATLSSPDARSVRPGAGAFRATSSVIRNVSYLFIPAGIYLVLRYFALGGLLHQSPTASKTVNILADAPAWQHVLGVIQLWGMYWAKTFWPGVLCIHYSIHAIRLPQGVVDPLVLLGLAVTFVLMAASIFAWRRKRPETALLSAALLITYLPTANLFVLLQVFFAERIWYLPSVWLALLVGLAVANLGFGQTSKRQPIFRRLGVQAAPYVGLVIVAAMMIRCWIRDREWRNNGTLFAAAYRDQPEGIGVLHLYGQWLVHHGDVKKGIELLERALESDLGLIDAHRDLGFAYEKLGDPENALKHLQIANMQGSGHAPTSEALERISTEVVSRRFDEVDRLRELADASGSNLEDELAYIRKLREIGRTQEASVRLAAKENTFAQSAEWQAEYAVTLVFLDRIDEAIERYREALGLQPENGQWAVEVAMLFLERRKGDDLKEASYWVEHAARITPNAPTVFVCRAELLAAKGEIHAAINEYRKAIDRLPPDSPMRTVYVQRARVLGQ